MRPISEKLGRLHYLDEQIPKVDAAIKRLEVYAEDNQPAKLGNGNSHLTILDPTGHNGVTVFGGHILAYPGAVRELLQLRLAALKKERDEIEEVLNIAERLFHTGGQS